MTLSGLGHAMAFLANLLNLVEYFIADDSRMCIRNDCPVQFGIDALGFIPDGIRIGPKIHRAARILSPFENMRYRI